MGLSPLVPDEETARAISNLLAAREARPLGSGWPGWSGRLNAVGLWLSAQGAVCLLGEGPLGRRVVGRDGLPLEGVHVVEEAQGGPWTVERSTSAWIEGVPAVERWRIGDSVWSVAVHAAPAPLLAHALGADAFARQCLRASAADGAPPLARRGSAEAFALRAVEGCLWEEVIRSKRDAGELVRIAWELALLRRERRSAMEDDDIAAERAAEVLLGLSAYVGAQFAAALGGTSPLKAVLRRLSTLDAMAQCAACGWAMGLLLDAWEQVVPPGSAPRRRSWAGRPEFPRGWRTAVAEGVVRNLDEILESRVPFDGGGRDDRTLEGALLRHAYAARLTAAAEALAASSRAHQTLVEAVLQGPGTLLVLATGELGAPTIVFEKPPQAVHSRLRVYPQGAEFRYRHGARISIRSAVLAEDLQSGLLQVRVPGRLRLSADGGPPPAEADLAFTDGLRLTVGGVSVAAAEGVISVMDGGFFIHLKR